MFKLKFETDNAAFSDGMEEYEISRILQVLSKRICDGKFEGLIIDSNGNTIGSYSLTK